jgi:hypothetical protein
MAKNKNRNQAQVDEINEVADSGVNENESQPEIPVVIESIEAQPISWNVGRMVELVAQGKINFNVPVQRGYVWNNKKDSLAIRSIIRMIPLSNFYFNKVDGIYEGLEGKQRSSAICRFVNNEYKLFAKTPPVKIDGEVFEIARKKFNELPKTIQNRILGYPIDGHWFDNMSLEEKYEFFILTNSGKPVTAADLFRMRIKSRELFWELADHPAIGMSVSEAFKRRFVDEDIVSQLWCMCFNDKSDSLLQKDTGPVLAETDVTNEQKEQLVVALDYLQKLYQDVGSDKKIFSKMRRRTHILSLAYAGYVASKQEISKEDFSQKIISFFTTGDRTASVSDEYNRVVGTGSAKAAQVIIRKAELTKALK